VPPVLLSGGPQKVVAADHFDEGGDLLLGEVGEEVLVRLSCSRLRVLVGVEAETVENRPWRLVATVQDQPRPVVNAILTGVELGVWGEGVGGLWVDLLEGVGELRARGHEEGVRPTSLLR
jgi:hypothetical protein